MHKNRIAKVIPLVIFSFLVFSGCKKEEQTQKTETPAIVELMTVEQKDTPFVVEYVVGLPGASNFPLSSIKW